ncbi:oxidoreductase [Streptomyces cinnamoneus]|uniref:Oxidoreductase n=1 Tax=Streptomyces cinnamoneus TaxID=53446 RepID=A0A2G1XIE0_STRCJ|nr:NAD(P)-binding domain-containing protein [Streptomyces cinnamoneus]PHQ50980.1 oxidoreductase [Streptomyces cinnamoneus]PPT13798.1 NAD(P)/FAD-dependent oxidoreductase [Streptomyces cinnamoneus]
MTLPVAVIGAGPYGLSTAAHLKACAVPTRVFGSPMVSWQEHMPAGMLLKSTPPASNIDAPQPGHTLFDFCQDVGERRFESDWDAIPVETFAQYGLWFQRRLVPGLERERVVSVERREGGGGFELKLDSGEQFAARAVVVATGLSGLARLPAELAAAVPDGPSASGPVSHSSQHSDLSVFAGKDVVVVGAGQSALESAVLLAESGAASVRVVARRKGAVRFGAAPDGQSPLKPDTPFGRAWSLYAFSYHADGFRHLPAPTRQYLVRRVLGPLGAWWLRERFVGRVLVTEGKRIVAARVESGRPVLTLSGEGDTTGTGAQSELHADHVIAATGYRVDVAAMDFLGPGLRTRLAVSAGGPRLGPGYRSSVPGLFFTGLPAAASYGPVMRFVCGTEYASPRLARAVAAL